jgi:hypothetical protein
MCVLRDRSPGITAPLSLAGPTDDDVKLQASLEETLRYRGHACDSVGSCAHGMSGSCVCVRE